MTDVALRDGAAPYATVRRGVACSRRVAYARVEE